MISDFALWLLKPVLLSDDSFHHQRLLLSTEMASFEYQDQLPNQVFGYTASDVKFFLPLWVWYLNNWTKALPPHTDWTNGRFYLQNSHWMSYARSIPTFGMLTTFVHTKKITSYHIHKWHIFCIWLLKLPLSLIGITTQNIKDSL